MSRRNERAKRGDRRFSPPVASSRNNRYPPTENFCPRNPPHLRVARDHLPQADYFPRTRKDPARVPEHSRGPCLTCGRSSKRTAPFEEDAFVCPRPRVFRLQEERRKGATVWLPRAPRFSHARQVLPQHFSQTGRPTPPLPLPPKLANDDRASSLSQSSAVAAKTSVYGRRSRTYAQVTAQGNTGGTKPDTSANSPRSVDPLKALRHPDIRPVDPLKEGRCLRCLARGHMARDCREPMKCRLCRHGGHRQVNCSLRQRQEVDPASTGLYACLVGECSRADVAWKQILAGIQALCPELNNPDGHWLASGEVFLRGLSKISWQRLHGRSMSLCEGRAISWRRPRPTDGALVIQKEIRRIEVRGVPFGLCKWHQLEQIIRLAGALRKIVCNGLNVGDPNCLCLDVEMETDSEVPRTLRVTEGAGAGLVIMMVTLPPPPPLHLPPPCQQVASCPEQAAQPATSLAGDEENHQLHVTCKQQHLSQQDLSDLQNPPSLINAETETHDQISSIPASTPDTALALRAEGPPDSLLLYRS